MTPAHAALVTGAGVLAGAINAVAGGGTLVAFPALLGVGVGPLTANITCSVGLITGYAGGSVAYRRELAGQRDRVRALLPFAVMGGLGGAVLLLVTPPSTFRAVVPYLVLLSAALLAVQPGLSRVLRNRQATGSDVHWGARVGVGAAAVYGSYFGAGLGVLLLAVLGILIADGLQRLNALKGVLSLLINVVGAAIFVLSARVDWGYALALAIGAYVGGTLGVSIARRLHPTAMRAAVVVLGIVVGIGLLVT
ncbi:MAG: uncharacterized protein QOJ79_1770 [Actinomycetota bacterium]|jgi:uncharacterized membrane protein YfcA|nr:uncharacterized protein [Actinomycetota bacterium]